MDPLHARDQPGGSGPVSQGTTAASDAIGATSQGQHAGVAVPPWMTMSGLAKDTGVGEDAADRVPEDSLIRDSWVSSTRDSAVPSLFSVRASTASAATRYSVRQSSIESPISATSLLFHEHRKDSIPERPRYCCTFCDVAFETKAEWKLHEYDFHDRRERYQCRTCPAMFSRAALLSDHGRTEHGVDPDAGPAGAVSHFPIRSAWGCGFCAAFIPSRNDFLEHVGQHYDEGKEKTDWQHTRVIQGLLCQPQVDLAWGALVKREELARGAKLRFLWDPDSTGRVADGGDSSALQDLLEFFANGKKTAEDLAAVAYSSAQVRLEANVSELISRLYVRTPEPRSVNITQKPPQLSPELQPTTTANENDLVSPMSPLPAPFRPPTAPPRMSEVPPTVSPSSSSLLATRAGGLPRPAPSDAAMLRRGASQSLTASMPTNNTAFPQAEAPFLSRMAKQSGLRRIESARNLGQPDRAGVPAPLNRPGVMPLPAMRSLDNHPSKPFPHAVEQRLPAVGPSSGLLSVANNARGSPATTSVREHTSSSTLSIGTGEGSPPLPDSASDVASDDSLSEPDTGAGVGGLPAAPKPWKKAFQQTLDRGMRRSWARYNRDLDALIQQCVGSRNSDSSQVRDNSGRVRKGASSSRQGFGRGFGSLGSNSGSLGQDDEEDEDDGEGYRPPSSLSKRSSDPVKRFACPFRKRDPHIYNIHDHEVCAIRSWSTISRLKEHLYRRHYKTHCQRCKQIFNDAKELTAHEMSVGGCEVLNIIPPGDITTYQEKQLKSRKHTTRRQTDEEKWRDIYRLLFPNTEIPSPYPEPAEDLAPPSTETHASLHFQHFLLTQMPTLFAKTAEEHAGRHLQAHDVLPMEAIPRIIEGALHQAFKAWESRGSEVPPSEASVASMSFMPETPTSLTYALGPPQPHPQPPPHQQHPVTAYHHPRQQHPHGPDVMAAHGFPQGTAHFGAVHHPHTHTTTTTADDSGFEEPGPGFFTSGPPVDLSGFAPPVEYQRGPWDASLGMLGAEVGGFDGADGGLGGHGVGGHGVGHGVGHGHYRGFQDG